MLENNHTIHLTLNGESRAFTVEPQETLLHVLRERAHLTGAKKGCDLGECGACTVIMDGRAVNSCCVFAIEADGSTVETIEGIGTADEPHPLQQAFIDAGAIQCGYCTPGIIMAAKALLLENPHPTPDEIKEALSGNYCRCISHYTVMRAINRVAGNGEDHTAVLHRANDDVKDPIPVREELFLSPYAYGTSSDRTLD